MPGSAVSDTYEVALDRVTRALETVLDGYGGSAQLLLEVCAGQGQTIGDTFEELADIIHSAWRRPAGGSLLGYLPSLNAGFDVTTPSGLADETIDRFGTIVGFDRLKAVHANDSKTPLGARVGPPRNVGAGFIGEEAFERMLHEPFLRNFARGCWRYPETKKRDRMWRTFRDFHRLAGMPELPSTATGVDPE